MTRRDASCASTFIAKDATMAAWWCCKMCSAARSSRSRCSAATAAGAEAAIAAGVGLVVGVSEKALDTEADIVVRDLVGITFDGDELVIPDKNRLR